jgi:hypothetical protein
MSLPPRPKRSGRRGTRIASRKLTLPRAPGAIGLARSSATAVQPTVGLEARAPRTSEIRIARGARHPPAPLPHSRTQMRSSGAVPGFVTAICSRPVQSKPPLVARRVSA